VTSLSARKHYYFTLEDEASDAVIRCVLFGGIRSRGGRYVEEGARVKVRAQIALYAPRGHLQLRVLEVRPAGRGSLLVALEQLKQKLMAEGLFSPPSTMECCWLVRINL